MPNLQQSLLELIRLASTSLPADVEKLLRCAYNTEEEGTAAKNVMGAILENIALARASSTPVCQDTGTPIFYVSFPIKYSMRSLEDLIRSAVAEATSKSYLRPNAVNSLSGENSGNNLGGEYFPFIHFKEAVNEILVVDLLLKGGGCENVGRQYSLPDVQLNAGRDLEGVRRVALDAVHQAQGMGCAPGFLGIAIGGDRGSSYLASKETFLEQLGSCHPDKEVAAMEGRITREANQLGIGPMGFGGKNTILGTRITGVHRLPASYFVSVSYMCWAFRRCRMIISGESVEYIQDA